MNTSAIATVRLQHERRDRLLIEGVIAKLELFRDASPAQLAAVSSQCWTLLVRKFGAALERSARPLGVFAVAYGTVKLALRTPSGAQRMLRLVSAGQTFGEAAALLGQRNLYEAQAIAESKLVVIPTAALYALVDRDPRFARSLLLSLAERKRELLAEIESVTYRRGAERLAHYLDSLAARRDAKGACSVHLPTSKTLLAARLGMKKETLSRLLRALALGGLIVITGREIAILDQERLAAVGRGTPI
jgi:CRP-like cAMP-binding protein